MPGDSSIYDGQMRQNTPLNVALCKIWYRLWQLSGFSTSGDEGGGTQQTPAASSTTASTGSVPAGFKSVAFVTSSDWVGTIAGGSWPASASLSFSADQFRTLGGINYTRSAGTLYIATLSS